LGASQDLELYHNGTNSIINHTLGSGALRIQANDLRLMNNAGNEHYFVGFANDYAGLYFDNSQKFKTLSTGAKVIGQLNFDDGSSTANTNGIGMGTSQDCRIFHDGSSFQVRNTTGPVTFITPSHFQISADSSNDTMFKALQDAGVKLYYDNSEKIETRPTGLRMQNSSTFDVNGGLIKFGHCSSAGTDDTLMFGSNGDDLKIFHGGNAQFDCNTGNMELRHVGSFSSARSIFLRARVDESSVTAISDGAVELYYDNTIRFETQSDGARTTGLDKVRSADLNVTHVTRPLYLSIATNTTKTITLTGLIGSAKFTAGGYANAGQGALALHILFGGAMFATQHYNVNVLQNSAMQNTSTSLTKNGTSYVIAISNSSNTYSLNLSMCLEYIGATVGYAVA